MSNASQCRERRDHRAPREADQAYVRRTPVIAIDGADVGLAPCALRLKLELLQHSGSFKVRGAFANLLMRTIPAAGFTRTHAAAGGASYGRPLCFLPRGEPRAAANQRRAAADFLESAAAFTVQTNKNFVFDSDERDISVKGGHTSIKAA
jgi:hypothetical protein